MDQFELELRERPAGSLAACDGNLHCLLGFITRWNVKCHDGGALGERPTGTRIGEGCEAGIANIVAAELQNLEGWECPTGTSRSKRRETDVPDLVQGQFELFKSWERPTGTSRSERRETDVPDLV